MTKSVKSVGIMLAAAVSAVSSAHALTAPTLKAAGFSNGQLTVCVQKTPISSTTLEVQMKNLGAAANMRPSSGNPSRRSVISAKATMTEHTLSTRQILMEWPRCA